MSTNLKTILVVEDEDEIGTAMKAMLDERGYRVLRAREADAAIKLAEEKHPALILTDLDFPELDSMMQRLRAHEILKNMRVAVIDINHPEQPTDGLKILNNFEELDQLLDSTPAA